MRTMSIQIILRAVALSTMLFVLAAGQAEAAEEGGSGVVVMTIGQVTAQDGSGKERPLQRRSTISAQETILTAEGARAQIRLTDGSLISLQEKSSFKIASYSYGGKEGKGDNAAYELLKGGMRTISGAIGKTNHNDYKVSTPVATIGIRGTDYELVLHEAADGKGNGLYGYINDGVINVANEGGAEEFGFNQFFVVSDAKHPPKSLLDPPDFMFEGYVPPHRDGGDHPAGEGIFSGLSSGIERVLLDSDNSQFDINNPSFTPFATVERLTGLYDYSTTALPTVINGPSAVSSMSSVVVDFNTQTILNVNLSVTLSDGSWVWGSHNANTILLSDVIAGGQTIPLAGTCSGPSCMVDPNIIVAVVYYPLAGDMSFQFIGNQAQAAVGSYTLQQTVSNGLGITDTGLYTPTPMAGW